ncbi:MAG: SpoIID/LytB domain-containing protein, partial [Candidatus Dojkabacteria bacterium]
MLNSKLKTKIVSVAVILICSVFVFNNISFAKSSDEIGQDIANQQAELKKKQDDLNALQDNLASYQTTIEESTGELPKLQAELEKATAEVDAKSLELELVKQAKDIKELERQQRQINQNETLKMSYMEWRMGGSNLSQFINTDFDYKKIEQYASSLTGAQQRNIFSLAKDLKKISEDIDVYNEKIIELEGLKTNLAAQKKTLEDQIAYYNGALAYGNQKLGDISVSIQSIKTNIDGLNGEQVNAKQREDALLANPPPPINPGTPVAGGFVFKTQGRDLYQGHGVGMSQWGAYGMANAGYPYQNILTFYFTGVAITGGYENTNFTVNENYGNGNIVAKQMNIEDFVTGQSEVPLSWPAEAIKAQIVAFRTYVLKYVNLYGSLNVCYAPAYVAGTCSTSTVAYDEGLNSRAYVDATRGQVITYGGGLIEALYSADNNQGTGTANNDTIFQNLYGDGTPYPYLRAVNDASVAANTYYTYWQA